MNRIAILVAALCCLFACPTLAQQDYPTKTVRIIVPFAPGGSTDIFARYIADKLALALAQPVVVENRAGAAGNIGADAVAHATPDGYTLLMATTGVMSINNSLYPTMTYDAAKDFEPVIFVASITNVLVVPSELPANNVRELIALAKDKPGSLSFGSSGAGSSTHLSSELFKSMAGIDVLHIPYKGSSQALTDLITGRISMVIDNMPGAISFIKAGRLRALGVTGSKRSPALPDVPTIAEAGLLGTSPCRGAESPFRRARLRTSSRVLTARSRRSLRSPTFATNSPKRAPIPSAERRSNSAITFAVSAGSGASSSANAASP